MGNCASSTSRVGYTELRESIPGSLVSEQDFDLFYSLCKVESARTISSVLIPNQSPLFYVVVSGEVHVHLTCSEMKNKSTIATIFATGETIHFFNASLRTTHFPSVTAFDFGDILRSNGVKLALHLKGLPNATARVIGMDRNALEEFMVLARHNTHALTSFLNLSMTDMTNKSPYLKTISQEQAAMFGVLMKVRLSHIGGVISPVENESLSCHSDSTSAKSPSERLLRNLHASQSFRTRCCTPAGPVSFILSGTALSAPYGVPLHPLVQKIKQLHQTPKAAKTPKVMFTATSTNKLLSPLSSFSSFQKKVAHPPAIFSQVRADADVEKDPDECLRQYVTISPGIMMGLGGVYCRDPPMSTLSVVASSPCVIGYLNYTALDALFAADPRFNRVLQRNFFMQIMNWFKPTVPFLRDMDQWSLALLSCKVTIKSFLSDSLIYQRGSPSEFAYIIVGGAIKETMESGALKVSPMAATPRNAMNIERILNTGTLFGEVALATNNPYFSTVTTKEPTMVLCISKHVLEQIYNNNKTKLCEIRIRLLGGHAALQHVVDHPRGCQLFQAYLDKEMAGENLRFYTAVDRFDSMCDDVLKQYHHLVKTYAKYMQELYPARKASEGILSVTSDHTEGSKGSKEGKVTMEDATSIDHGLFIRPNSDSESFDSERNHLFGASKSVTTPGTSLTVQGASSQPDTFTTQGVTLHSSFASEATDQSLYQYMHSDVPQSIRTTDTHTTDTKSRNNSVDSDLFLQQFTLANSGSTSDRNSFHENTSPFKTTKMARKPVLESIISESAMSLEESKKFSVKFKPTQHASLKNSQILPLTEIEHENDEESAHVNAHTLAIAVRNLPALDTTIVVPDRVIAAVTMVDPEKAKEVARHITQKLHRIQKNIVELKQVARSIMQTYIYNGSEHQLNLPGALRTRTETQFKAWATSLLASVTRDALANAHADEDFQGLQPSIDRMHSFDFADESTRNATKNGVFGATHGAAVENSRVGKSTGDASQAGTNDHSMNTHEKNVHPMYSESSDLTPSSHINNDFTPVSHNYSADDYGHNGAFVSNSVDNNLYTGIDNTNATGATTAGASAGGTTVRKLSNLHSGFKASAPFITSFAPKDSSNVANTNTSATVFFKPSPIQIPSRGYLSSTSTVASPMYTNENATQTHTGRNLTLTTNLLSDMNATERKIATQVQSIDLSFVHLFTEAKAEILKLLRDDKFPRFKLTHEFDGFINAIQPYEQEVKSGDNGYSHNNMDNSLSALGVV